MQFDLGEIRQIVKTERNLALSFQYAAAHAVLSFTIKELANNSGFIIRGIVTRSGYDHECYMHVDAKYRVVTYTCDCPYCSELQACAHIGALMLNINARHPLNYPYEYHDEAGEEPYDGLKEYEAYKKQQKLEQEQRQQAIMQERRRKAEAERIAQVALQLSYSQQMILQEKDDFYHKFAVDHSGRVKLRLRYEGCTQLNYRYGVQFSLQIGRTRLYVVKNILGFVENVQHQQIVNYGKELSFVHSEAAFDEESQMILAFLYKCCDCISGTSFVAERRNLSVTGELLREFYELCASLPEAYCEFSAVAKALNLDIKVQQCQDYFELELCNLASLQLGYLDESGLYQVDRNTILYQTCDETGKGMRLIQRFQINQGRLLIASTDMQNFSKYIWQDIQQYVTLQGNPAIFRITELEALSLYGDMDEKGQMSLRLEGMLQGKRIYGFDDTLDEKPLQLEIVETYIKNYASVIDPQDHVAYLPVDDDSTYTFIKDGLPFLQENCDVFISDAIMKLGTDHHINLQAGIRLQGNLLEVSFVSNEITKEELADVLRAYRRKKKYHRLKNGHLISLDAVELQEFEEVVDCLGVAPKDIKDGCIQLPAYRSFALEEQFHDIDVTHNTNYQRLLTDFAKKDLQEFVVPEHFQNILRDYQVYGYQWMKLLNHYHFGAILADDMGLGKTIQVIALLDSEQSNGPSIVITPSSLILNWQDEIQRFAKHLHVLCIMGSSSQRMMLIREIQEDQIVITSYDYLRRDIEAYASRQFHYIVLDEAQYIKNQKTKNARCVKALQGTHKLALTGTPIENSLAELWSIFDFLMPGYLYHYHYFAQKYEQPIVKEHNEQCQRQLKRLVEPFILRRNKQEVLQELPSKVEHTLTIAFSEEEQKLYLAHLMQVSTSLQKQLDAGAMDHVQILSMLTRLRQICCEPRVLFENIHERSSKLQACLELCQSLKEHHQRVLIFSSFTSVLELLETELYKHHFRCLKLTGKNTKEERHQLVKQFQEGQANVFLISLKAGGTGLNLTAAQAVIHFDPWWNVSAQNQATDRAYRFGQEKNVQVFKLIMKDSVEEKIQRLQAQKKTLADQFVEQNTGSITSMKREELMELFTIEK